MNHWLTLLGLSLFVISPVPAQELTDEALERWFESDEMTSPYEEKGGDATLQFIHPAPDEAIPHSYTRLRFDEASHSSGWVMVEQCHQGLDAVPDAEVVYRFSEMRQLRVIRAENIEKTWVEGQSVQLKNVATGAKLCVELQARLLHKIDGGNYRMRYGPFQRRFLDSYFPMHVTLEVGYIESALRFVSVVPAPVPGFSVEDKQGVLRLEARFRGELLLELQFESREE